MTVRNQYFPPLYLPDLESEQSFPLTRVPFAIGGGDEFNEDWLQERLFRHPDILPLGAFDALAAPAIPLCRELPTDAGPADLAFLSGAGRLTIVECKLWRNPEARRAVVVQILDYAKEIAKWDYGNLESAVKRAAGDGKSIADRLRVHQPDLDDAALHDEVQANLSRGRFNLPIIGDGIREGTRQLVEYLTRDLGLGYRFGLIELAVYRMPEGVPPGFILQPRILVQTTEISRVVVFGSADGTATTAPDAGEAMSQEDQIRAALNQRDPGLLPMLDSFFAAAAPLGVRVSVLQSLTLLRNARMAEILAELRAAEREVTREWQWLHDTLNEIAPFAPRAEMPRPSGGCRPRRWWSARGASSSPCALSSWKAPQCGIDRVIRHLEAAARDAPGQSVRAAGPDAAHAR